MVDLDNQKVCYQISLVYQRTLYFCYRNFNYVKVKATFYLINENNLLKEKGDW